MFERARRCRKCGQPKLESDFGRDTKRRDGLRTWCKECTNAATRATVTRAKALDPERVRQGQAIRHARWWTRHKERHLAAVRANRAARRAQHPPTEEERAQWRTAASRRYRADRKKGAAIRRAWRYRRRDRDPQAERELQREYRLRRLAANPARVRLEKRIHAAIRRGRKRSARADHVDYRRIYERDKMRCHLCGRKVSQRQLHFDHVIPLAAGGSHTEENIAVAHARCNLTKGTKVLSLF